MVAEGVLLSRAVHVDHNRFGWTYVLPFFKALLIYGETVVKP